MMSILVVNKVSLVGSARGLQWKKIIVVLILLPHALGITIPGKSCSQCVGGLLLLRDGSRLYRFRLEC